MRRFIITAFIGGLIFFIWNAISWMVLPFHGESLKTLPETHVPRDTPLSSGVYHYPGLDAENLAQRLAEGPRIPLMVYINEGTDAFDPFAFLNNFLLNVVTSALLLFVLMKQTDKKLRSLLLTSAIIGLVIGLSSDLPQMNWFMFPLKYTLINVFDHLIGFALVGLCHGLSIHRT